MKKEEIKNRKYLIKVDNLHVGIQMHTSTSLFLGMWTKIRSLVVVSFFFPFVGCLIVGSYRYMLKTCLFESPIHEHSNNGIPVWRDRNGLLFLFCIVSLSFLPSWLKPVRVSKAYAAFSGSHYYCSIGSINGLGRF